MPESRATALNTVIFGGRIIITVYSIFSIEVPPSTLRAPHAGPALPARWHHMSSR